MVFRGFYKFLYAVKPRLRGRDDGRQATDTVLDTKKNGSAPIPKRSVTIVELPYNDDLRREEEKRMLNVQGFIERKSISWLSRIGLHRNLYNPRLKTTCSRNDYYLHCTKPCFERSLPSP
jgi:hypothetical protein